MSRSAEDLRQCMSGALASGGAGDRRAQRPDGADAADAGLLWLMRGWNLGLRGSCRCYRRRPSGVGCARLSAVSTSQQAKAPACGYVALPPRRLRYGRPSDQAVQVRTAWPRGNATPFIPEYKGPRSNGPSSARTTRRPGRPDLRHRAGQAGCARRRGHPVWLRSRSREISPAYAKLQEPPSPRPAAIGIYQVAALVKKKTAGRDLRFIGGPRVNVLQLNLALDGQYPVM